MTGRAGVGRDFIGRTARAVGAGDGLEAAARRPFADGAARFQRLALALGGRRIAPEHLGDVGALAEHRQRQMEEAAAAAQLEVSQFDLLPRPGGGLIARIRLPPSR